MMLVPPFQEAAVSFTVVCDLLFSKDGFLNCALLSTRHPP